MKTKCPNCKCSALKTSGGRNIVRIGSFWRKSDGQSKKRFWCKICEKGFSQASSSPALRQKKRHKNAMIRKLLVAGVSQRECARILNINRKTVVRKFLYLAEKEARALEKWNQAKGPCAEVEFDDFETFEHTKCKPLSVILMVEYRTRRILGFKIAQMPAKGKLATFSRRKYGFRADRRKYVRRKFFAEMRPLISSQAVIRSDSSPFYPADVSEFFPSAKHQTIMGGRGSSTGGGELKKKAYDPIFSLNHTCAMWRANVNRLIRKTWCTTKKPDRLAAHLSLYVMSHNRRLSPG